MNLLVLWHQMGLSHQPLMTDKYDILVEWSLTEVNTEVVKADFAPGPLTNHKSRGLCCD